MSKSQRLPTLLALAAAAAISAGGVAAACPDTFSSPPATETASRGGARYHIKYVSMRETSPSLLERLGLFGVLPFAVGYGVTTIVGRRGRRRRRRHD